jgi:hypothetical protein
VDPEQVTICVEAAPVLSYAMAHNGVSVIGRLVVRLSPSGQVIAA